MSTQKIIQGDCIEIMKTLDENSVDAIITDPPYGLEFMGKEWDKFPLRDRGGRLTGNGNPTESRGFGMNVAYGNSQNASNQLQQFVFSWASACLRILKPGGFLLSFGGTRTYHRMVCGIEDAGFEIRDTIMWLYGSGFPKSLNIGKQIDKMNNKPQRVVEFEEYLTKAIKEVYGKHYQLAKEMEVDEALIRHWIGKSGTQYLIPPKKQYEILKKKLDLDNSFDYLINWVEAQREVIGKDGRTAKESMFNIGVQEEWDLTKAKLPEAKQWEGWGTALKPACEPIVVARKPLSEKNVALNVLKWGTGGINIDECRVGNEGYTKGGQNKSVAFGQNGLTEKQPRCDGSQGRFPSNIILDEEAGKMLDEQSGETGAFAPVKSGQKSWGGEIYHKFATSGDDGKTFYDNGKLGGASRFFYCAKASKSEREFALRGEIPCIKCGEINSETHKDENDKIVNCSRNNHPTIKPMSLIHYLIKFVSKKDSLILDPFLGSGTTAIACLKLGRKFIGIEKEPEYIKIANARIKPFLEQQKL